MSNIKPQYRPYNPIKPELESEFKYSRTLSYLDIFSAGYGFIVGAGIFTLLPFILKYSGGFSWLVFIIGGIICILTGLSYSKLNSKSFPKRKKPILFFDGRNILNSKLFSDELHTIGVGNN